MVDPDQPKCTSAWKWFLSKGDFISIYTGTGYSMKPVKGNVYCILTRRCVDTRCSHRTSLAVGLYSGSSMGWLTVCSFRVLEQFWILEALKTNLGGGGRGCHRGCKEFWGHCKQFWGTEDKSGTLVDSCLYKEILVGSLTEGGVQKCGWWRQIWSTA